MKDVEFNHFSLGEFMRRRRVLSDAMRAEGMDAVLVSTEENVRYLSGILNQYWIAGMHDDMQLALLPADEGVEPALFLADHLAGGTAKTSWIDDVRVWSQFGTGKSKTAVDLLVEALAEKGLARGRIGMEVGKGCVLNMPLPRYEALRGALEHAEIVDCAGVLARARMCKSAEELAYVRKSSEITCKAMRAGLEAVKEGMSEREMCHIMAEEALAHTDEGCLSKQWMMFVHGGKGRLNWFDGIPGEYRFKKGDPIYVDGGVTYRGYYTDIIRIASIGEPDGAHRRLFDANRKANLAVMEMMKPGVGVGELCQQLFAVWRECGCGKELAEQLGCDYDFLGHGVGLAIHEAPLLWSGSEEVLREGMVLALEGMLVDEMPLDKAKIALGIEENVAVTEEGHEWLTPLENEIWIK